MGVRIMHEVSIPPLITLLDWQLSFLTAVKGRGFLLRLLLVLFVNETFSPLYLFVHLYPL